MKLSDSVSIFRPVAAHDVFRLLSAYTHRYSRIETPRKVKHALLRTACGKQISSARGCRSRDLDPAVIYPHSCEQIPRQEAAIRHLILPSPSVNRQACFAATTNEERYVQSITNHASRCSNPTTAPSQVSQSTMRCPWHCPHPPRHPPDPRSPSPNPQQR